MSARKKRLLSVSCGLVLLGGLFIFFIAGGGAAQQALGDVGRFRVGSALGEERAGFSGRVLLQVFANPEAPDWAATSACLGSAELERMLALYTPILIDERDSLEAAVEAPSRQRGFSVVVRGLDGRLLGGLRRGFTCAELVALLADIPQRTSIAAEKSPIYAALLESPAALDGFLLRGERAKAEKFVEFLREFEGASSAAVAAAEARLGR